MSFDSFVVMMLFSMQETSFVGNSIENLFNHDSLEDDEEDMHGGEEVASLGLELPLGAILQTLDVCSLLNHHVTSYYQNCLDSAKDRVVDHKDLDLFFEYSCFSCILGVFIQQGVIMTDEVG